MRIMSSPSIILVKWICFHHLRKNRDRTVYPTERKSKGWKNPENSLMVFPCILFLFFRMKNSDQDVIYSVQSTWALQDSQKPSWSWQVGHQAKAGAWLQLLEVSDGPLGWLCQKKGYEPADVPAGPLTPPRAIHRVRLRCCVDHLTSMSHILTSFLGLFPSPAWQ